MNKKYYYRKITVTILIFDGREYEGDCDHQIPLKFVDYSCALYPLSNI